MQRTNAVYDRVHAPWCEIFDVWPCDCGFDDWAEKQPFIENETTAQWWERIEKAWNDHVSAKACD